MEEEWSITDGWRRQCSKSKKERPSWSYLIDDIMTRAKKKNYARISRPLNAPPSFLLLVYSHSVHLIELGLLLLLFCIAISFSVFIWSWLQPRSLQIAHFVPERVITTTILLCTPHLHGSPVHPNKKAKISHKRKERGGQG